MPASNDVIHSGRRSSSDGTSLDLVEGTRPIGLKWRSSTPYILSTVAVGIFSDLFLYAVMVPVLPFMLRDLIDVPEEQVQSEIDALLAMYAGGSVFFSPVAGVLADRMTSRQAPFLAGIFTLFAATLLLFLGRTLPVLYASRLLQGMSSAVVWTVGMALTVETIGTKNLGIAIGSMFTFINVGMLFAPPAGGALYTHVGYQGVFALSAAILIVDFIMRVILIEKSVAAKYKKVTSSSEVDDGTTTPNSQQNVAHEASAQPDESSSLLQGHDLGAYKIVREQPSWVHKLPFLYTLRDTSLLASLMVAFIQAMVLAAFDATLPKFSEETFGFNSLSASLLFIPMGVVDGIMGPICGRAVDRYGTKLIGTIGYITLTPMLIMLRLVTEDTPQQLALFCVLLALCGFGLSLIGSPSLVEAGAVLERYYEANTTFFNNRPPYAQLYGLNSMVFMAGLTVGPLLAGSLKDSIGYGNMNAVEGVITAATAGLCWRYLGQRPKLQAAC